MQAVVRLEGPDGTAVELQPGDVIGRSWRAALRLDDPRVSEAHAMVSLRAGGLRLLALRGGMAVDRKRVHDVELVPGLTVHLASGVALHVLEVRLPKALMAVGIDGGLPVSLTGAVQSLVGDPVRLEPGYRAEALAHLWSDGDAWLLQRGDGAPERVEVGHVETLGSSRVELVSMTLEGAGAPSTVDAGRINPPLHIVARYHSVHLHRRGLPVVTLSGQPALLLSELVAMDGLVEWSVLAGQVWRRHSRKDTLRKKLDAALARLRKKLADGDVRDDLVRSDGTGRIELVLYDGDRVEDLT